MPGKTNNFKEVIQRQKRVFANFLRDQFPRIIETESLNFFDESWDREGWLNGSLDKWPKRKSQRAGSKIKTTKSAKRNAGRRLLVDTGALRGSAVSRVMPGAVYISYTADYAAVHNEGGMAGRNRLVRMPKRQFLGASQDLNERIIKTSVNYLKARL